MVKVYDEKNKLVAVFSDAVSTSHSESSAKDILVAPTVSNIINSESTLTFQILKDSEKWKEVENPLYEWHVAGRVYIALKPEAFIYEGDLVSVTLVEKWYELGKCFAQVHNTDTSIEALDEHTVKILPKSETSNKMTVNGTKYDDSVIKDSRGVLLPRGSAGYALWGLLKANPFDWTLGICDVIIDDFNAEDDYGTFNLESDMESILTNIQNVQSLWGGILVWDSLNKVVHLRDETKTDSDFNIWKGYEVRKGKNMLTEPQITIDNSIITKAYILGNNNLNIKAVNNDKSYVENYSYTDKVYEGYLTNPNIYYTGSASTSGQKQLLEWGKTELAKKCKPREQASINIIDRRTEQDFSHETFEIGDNVKVYYENSFTKEITIKMQRVIQHSFNVWDISDATIVVGDVIMNQRDVYKMVYNNALDPYLNSEDITLNVDGELSEYYNGGTRATLYELFEGNAYIVTEFKKNTEEEFVQTRAGIELLSTEVGSLISLFTEYTEETEEKFVQTNSKIDLISSELGSQITASVNYTNHQILELENSTETQIQQSYAYIDLVASDLENRITLEVGSALGNGVIQVTDREVTVGLNSYPFDGQMIIDQSGIRLLSTYSGIVLSSENTIQLQSGNDISIEGYRNISLSGREITLSGEVTINGDNVLTNSNFQSAEMTVVTDVDFANSSALTRTIYYLQWR